MVSIIDLFAGPGGLGEGFSSLTDSDGNRIFQIAMSVERDASAHSTLRLRAFLRQILDADGNVPEDYLEYISEPTSARFDALVQNHPAEWERANEEACLDELVKGDDRLVNMAKNRLRDYHGKLVLIGGPPCQAYSLVGRARRTNDKEGLEQDVKQTLYECYLRFIEVLQPDVFVMENVKGMLSAKHAGYGIFNRIVSDMDELGYSVHSLATEDPSRPADYIVRANLFGIPQARHRVILLGVKKDSENKPGILSPASAPVTVGAAFAGIPAVRSGFSRRSAALEAAGWDEFVRGQAKAISSIVNDEELAAILDRVALSKLPSNRSAKSVTTEVNAYTPWYRGRLGGMSLLTRHESRRHLDADLSRYLFCAAFAKANGRPANLYDFPVELIPKHKNVASLLDPNGNREEIAFADRFRVQMDDRPSTTVTSHISKDGHYFIHPDPKQCRSLTVREAARLQTFPDDYFFMGNRTSQYQQVGNAVPPMLAQQIAAVVARYLGFECQSFAEKLGEEEESRA